MLGRLTTALSENLNLAHLLTQITLKVDSWYALSIYGGGASGGVALNGIQQQAIQQMNEYNEVATALEKD